MPSAQQQFRWVRVLTAVVCAELLPVLLLVAIVFVYGAVRRPDSPSPEQFAPRAGIWVGPIGGFFATLFFAWWAGRGQGSQKMAHGVAVGLGAAILDLSLGVLFVGRGAMQALFFISNSGRIIAGVLGGWLAARSTGHNTTLAPPV